MLAWVGHLRIKLDAAPESNLAQCRLDIATSCTHFYSIQNKFVFSNITCCVLHYAGSSIRKIS